MTAPRAGPTQSARVSEGSEAQVYEEQHAGTKKAAHFGRGSWVMDISTNRPPTEHALINDFAIRCFRDTGDCDYIAARLAMRARLAGQFMWSAEQALEKYLKCILMLNRKSTRDLSHDILSALNRVNDELPFQITLRQPEREVFDHINEWGADRYLIFPFHVFDKEVLKLDLLVWRLRQYCVPLDVVHYADPPSQEILLKNVARIEAGLLGPAKSGHIGGFLEKVIAKKDHSARAALVWKNARYCGKSIKYIRFQNNWQAVNSPLYLKPELVDEVAKYMKLSKEVVRTAHDLAAERACAGTKP